MRYIMWKPLARIDPEHAARSVRNAKTGRLYELWGRCGLCKWSGPYPEFLELRKGDFRELLCHPCMDSGGAEFEAQLRADGWEL